MDLKLVLDKIDKLRIWGVKGALDYLVRICTPTAIADSSSRMPSAIP